MKTTPRGWRLALLAVVGMLAVLVAPLLPVAAQADPAAAAEFSSIVGQLPSLTPINPPVSGELDAANADSFPAGVSVANGVGHVEYTVPNVNPGTLWALGMLFRASDAGQNFLLVFPDGTWQLDTGVAGGGTSGTGATFDSTPGAVVALDVVFNGASGSFGLNGTFISTLDLTAVQGAGDVELTGYLGLGAGATTLDYANFAVYDLPGSAAAPTATSGTTLPPTVAPSAEASATEGTVALPTTETSPVATESTTAVAGDPEAIFNQYLIDEITKPIAFGPESGTLVHDPERITFSEDTNLSLTDFGTHIECVAPRSAAELWDCGLAFRDIGSPNHYRLGVVSDGHWFLSIGAQDPLQSGDGVVIPQNAGDTIALDLIVLGDKGYFGVDGTFVSELDLSALPGPGGVTAVVGFFNETFIEGGQTDYEDFIVWDLAEGATAPTPVTTVDIPSPTPTTAGLPTAIVPPPATEAALPSATAAASATTATGEVPGVVGNTYTSPSFGYTLAWDDTWSVVQGSSQDQFDVLRISNGVVTTDLYSGLSTMTLEQCVTSLADYYTQNADYSNVVLQTFPDGQQFITQGNVAIATINFTVIENGTPNDYVDSVVCVALPTQGALLTMESYIPPDQVDAQIAGVRALESSLVVDGLPIVLPTAPDAVATTAPTVAVPTVAATEPAAPTVAATATTASVPVVISGTSGSFALAPINGSGVSGIGTLEGQGRSLNVSAILLGAQPGSSVGIARGTCAELVNVLEPDYYVGDTTDTGIVQATVPVGLSVLLTRGPYAVVVYGPGEGAPMVACGEIVGA